MKIGGGIKWSVLLVGDGRIGSQVLTGAEQQAVAVYTELFKKNLIDCEYSVNLNAHSFIRPKNSVPIRLISKMFLFVNPFCSRYFPRMNTQLADSILVQTFSQSPFHFNQVKETLSESNFKQQKVMIISAGGRASSLAVALKFGSILTPKQPPPLILQILHPRMSLSAFDILITPKHDLAASNKPRVWMPSSVQETLRKMVDKTVVISSLGSLHLINSCSVKSQSHSNPTNAVQNEKQKSKQIALLIGGARRTFGFETRWYERKVLDLLRDLASFIQSNDGTLVVITSRRTGNTIYDAAFKLEKENTSIRCFGPEDTAKSPGLYRTLVNEASHLIVTDDSVSMISEACARAGQSNVLVARVSSCRSKRIHALIRMLLRRRHLGLYRSPEILLKDPGPSDEQRKLTPLNDMPDVINQVISVLERKARE
mmetsp:Transcript_483/g.875  ORF Transcript_483/g.875 Transcript_483/m.875 type:complete len:427 (-) Transcript_483:691-1971(-)